MWKLGMPRAFARSSIAGTNACQNSGLTWRAVSMRKPSIPNRSIQLPKMSIMPRDHPRVVGHQVVEADEIAHRHGLAAEQRCRRDCGSRSGR
jgi:hypothetical protein